MPLLCGALLVGSPLVMCCTIWSASLVVPLRAGAFMAGLPSPFAPWQAPHFFLYRAAPSSAADKTVDADSDSPAIITKHFQFMSTPHSKDCCSHTSLTIDTS